MTSSNARSNARAARRNVVWGMSSLSALVLLFGYHTSTEEASAAVAPVVGGSTSSSSAPTSPSGTAGSGTSSAASAGQPAATTSPSSATGAGPTTVTGQAVQTRYGPVQVQLTVTGGKVTAVDVLQHPDSNGKDQQINARALPILVKETLSAQNAKIDMVSGATYTSTGYTTSLQSALDQAGLA